MKALIGLTFFLIFAANAKASATYIPEHYLSGEEVTVKAANDDLAPAGNFVESVLKTESDILEANDSKEVANKSPKKFQMNLMMTNISITKGGLLGLSAFKANEFVSLFWTRKKIPQLVAEKTSDEVHKTVEIDGQATQEELDLTATELADSLFNSGLVNNKEVLTKNLKTTMDKANSSFGMIESMSYGNWDVSGLRLDLSIGVSGIVTPFAKVGVSTRVWIEWKRIKRPGVAVTTSASTHGGRKLQRFVSKVLADVDSSATNLNLPSFHLSQMYVGLGQDYKTGFFGIASTNFGFIGYIILNHKTTKDANIAAVADSGDDIPVVSAPGKRMGIFNLSRRKLRSSIQKTMHLAGKLIRNADNVSSTKWEVSRVRLITTLTKSGFFGISSLSTKGVFIHIFDRN